MKRAAACAAAVLLAIAAPASAGPQEVATSVSQSILSPFCPGVTLHDCPSAEADELRREIVTMAESGMSKDEILDALVAERGENILATPSNPVARWLPLGLVLVAAAGGLFLIRRWGRPDRGAARRRGLSPEEHARVIGELERFREGR